MHVNYQTGEWTAAFSVPIELRPSLDGNLALEVGGLVLALPGALAGRGEGEEPTVDAQVIDRGVLAERRARRAELAEQALLRRATEAEATVDTLQRQLTNLESRFARTNEELERLRPRLAQGEAERRRLRQREYGEQQQRLEVEERVRELEAQIAGETDGLHARLRDAERETRTLAAELELAQRALSEAQHAAAADRASLRRAQDELAARESAAPQSPPESAPTPGDSPQRVFVRVDSTEERVQALGVQLRSISDHLARRELALEAAAAGEQEARAALVSERARHDEELAALQRRVDELRGDLVTAIGLVRDELLSEHTARTQAEDELRAQHEIVQRLSEELERARTEAATTALALGELPLEHPPGVSSDAEVRRQREEMAEALAAAVGRLRARVAEFEQTEPAEIAPPVDSKVPAAFGPPAQTGRPDPSSEPAAPPAQTGRPEPSAEPAGPPAQTGRPDPLGEPADAPPVAEAPSAAEVPSAAEAPPAAEATTVRSLSPEVIAPQTVALALNGPLAPAPLPPSGTPPAMPPPDAVELAPRLQGVRPRPTEWLAGALGRAARHRDEQLVGELIAELLPAQGLVVRRSITYGVTIDGVGCYRVATTGGAPASVTRVEPDVMSGLDFEVRGSVAQVGAFVAGRGSWRLHGLRVTPGRRRRARRVTHARRVPLTLAELAAANVRVWPGLLLPVLAEAIDPQWTIGQQFVIALAITGVTPTVLYVGVHDGAPVTVSPRQFDVPPAATLYLSEQACLNLLARTPLPAGERVLYAGEQASVEQLLEWTDRAQAAA